MYCFWKYAVLFATITCFRMASLAPHGLVTPKSFKFYNNIYIKCYFAKLQTHFFCDILFIGCDIFPQVMVVRLHNFQKDLRGKL